MVQIDRSVVTSWLEKALIARAAYAGEPAPAGWEFVAMQELGIPPEMSEGAYTFDVGTVGVASAVVLRHNNGTIAISFRGTDSKTDVWDYRQIVNGEYWRQFLPLLRAVEAELNPAKLVLSGHSLGGAAVHQIAAMWASTNAIDDLLGPSPEFFSVSSPIDTADGIVENIGFSNDRVFNLLSSYDLEGLDVLVNVRNNGSPNLYFDTLFAHGIEAMIGALSRLLSSDLIWRGAPSAEIGGTVIFNWNPQLTNLPITINPSEDLFIFGVDAFDSIGGRDFRRLNDTITGRDSDVSRDFIDGMNGNDSLSGLRGVDLILGGRGRDTIFGGSGADSLRGGRDNDFVSGDSGSDRIFGEHGHDELNGQGGSDTIYGGDGNDALRGEYPFQSFPEAANDVLFGGNGNDGLYGGVGADFLDGGIGDDWIDGGPGLDTYVGGAGADEFVTRTVSLTAEVDVIRDFNPTDGDVLAIDHYFTQSLFYNRVPRSHTDAALLYVQRSGILYWDADGNGGIAPVPIVRLSNSAQISIDDIFWV